MQCFNIYSPLLRLVWLLFLSLTTTVFTCPIAIADDSGCSILGQLSTIQEGVLAISDADPAQLKNSVNHLMRALWEEKVDPVFFEQITDDPNWTDRFLQAHGQFLSLYISGQYYQANNLKYSDEFRGFENTLANLNAAFYCSPEGASDGNDAHGQIEEHRDSQSGDSWLLRAMQQIKSSIKQLLISQKFILLPVILLLSVGIAVWSMIRYDEFRRNCRRRFFCEIDATIRFGRGKSTVCLKAQITDISRSGAGIMVDGTVPEGVAFCIKCIHFDHKMRAVYASDDHIGAKFTKRLKSIPENIALRHERKFIPRREYLLTIKGQNPPDKPSKPNGNHQ